MDDVVLESVEVTGEIIEALDGSMALDDTTVVVPTSDNELIALV